MTALILLWVLWYCRYGIDFTDESFYLIWISNPFDYHMSVSQFGFVYHPLFQLVNGNIVALRRVNILITFSLAWVLSNVFLRSIYGKQTLDGKRRLIISSAVATSSLAILAVLPPTPSYNTLALQSLLVGAIGLLLANKETSRASILGWALIGVGGWLAFMAKPTTAAALAVCAVCYLIGSRKFSFRFLFVSLIIALGLVLCSALLIDGSVTAFLDRLRNGLEFLQLLSPDSIAVRLIRPHTNIGLRGASKLILIIATAFVSLHGYVALSRVKGMAYVRAALAILLAGASLAIVCGLDLRTTNVRSFAGLLLAVPFAAILIAFALYRFKGVLEISRAQWACALSFVAFPYIYAFGTNDSYWAASPHAALFWILASFALLGPVARTYKFTYLLVSLAIAVQVLTMVRIQNGIEAPYRQSQSLRENDYAIDIGRPGSKLILSRGFGQYFADAIEIGKRAGFANRTPMIDLTGQSPGILYAIRAKSVGQPWILGGYPGSQNTVIQNLKTVSCAELAEAWILTEPEGPREISPAIVTSFGANPATDFELAGTLMTAEGAGGYKTERVQQFLKPIRPVDAARAACVAARADAK